MTDVRFKDLCIDATAGDDRPRRVATFWSHALAQRAVEQEAGDFKLEAPEDGPKERTVWINVVPEAASGKARVHLDVRLLTANPAELVELGGRVRREPDDDVRWHVLDDPDGLTLCSFGPRPDAPGAFGPFELVVDAADPLRIATWWAERTGATVHHGENTDSVWIMGAAGFPFLFWVFNAVPEPKTVKNRMHWDVTLVDATLDQLCELGATIVRPKDATIGWTVMADPEGNEFCAFVPT